MVCFRNIRVALGALLAFCVAMGVAISSQVAAADSNTDASTSGAGLYIDPTNGLGSWIWSSVVSDNQTVLLWKSFDIPPSPAIWRARLCMTADNEFTVFLDGRELGHGSEWRELFTFDLTHLLSPGRHVFAVKAFNSYYYAGMILGLEVDLTDGRHIQIKSDASWKVVPDGVKDWTTMTEAAPDWRPATVEAPLGGAPWWTRPENIDKMPTALPIRVALWQTGWFQAVLLAICLIAISTSFWLVARLALHRKERWMLQRERARIARDIHDDLGSKITQLVLHSELAQSELPEGQKLHSELDMICHDARDVLSALDEILWAVNPKRDGVHDFISFVCNYAEHFLKLTSIQCFLDVASDVPRSGLTLPLRRGLLMVTKEALNNVVKHSGAAELKLQIRCEHGRLILVLQDDGKGFNPMQADNKRNGLNNMTQRMAELEGTCVIWSQPGKGCKIEISAPLKHSYWQFRNPTENLEQADK